jgi:hypothetical protein
VQEIEIECESFGYCTGVVASFTWSGWWRMVSADDTAAAALGQLKFGIPKDPRDAGDKRRARRANPGYLLGADAGQQAQDDISAEPGILGGLQERGGLLGGQRLALPASLALRGIDQGSGVVEDMTVGLAMAQGSRQRVVRDHDRPAGVVLSQLR